MKVNVFILSSLAVVLIKVIKGFDVQTVTSAGLVRGMKKYLPQLRTEIEVYLSVRYALAPINKLRFKEPIPAPKQSSLGSSEFPPTCPQREFETFKGFKGMEVWEIKSPIDEDCLFLNIWKPAKSSPKKPVIVWVHGGGYEHGSTSLPLYDGSYLAAWLDVVVVSIQYRLGAFGFLYTGDDFAPGNAGLKDQILALKWVNEHIDKFGGDKEMITIVGESAGSASVGVHVLSPETSKLFKRAIMLSGTPNSPWAIIDPSVAKNRTMSLAAKLGASTFDDDDIKKRLIESDWKDIVEATNNVYSDSIVNLVFWPTIEPKVIPDYPLHMLMKSKHLRGRETIASFTKDETSMFLAIDLKRANKIQTPTDTPHLKAEDLLGSLATVAGENENLMEELLKIYNKTSYLDGILQFIDDIEMKCPINQFVEEARRNGAIVYQFEFNHRTQNNAWPEWAGAVHTADIEIFFARPLHQRELFNDEDLVLWANFTNRINNFIRTGNPNLAGSDDWDKDQVFLVGQRHKNSDNRTSVCDKLKQLKLIPTYTSAGDRRMGFLALLVFIKILI